MYITRPENLIPKFYTIVNGFGHNCVTNEHSYEIPNSKVQRRLHFVRQLPFYLSLRRTLEKVM